MDTSEVEAVLAGAITSRFVDEVNADVARAKLATIRARSAIVSQVDNVVRYMYQLEVSALHVPAWINEKPKAGALQPRTRAAR